MELAQSILRCLTIPVILILAAPLHATESPGPFTLLALKQAPGGSALLDGQYDKAINAARPMPRSPENTLGAQVTLCVAHAMAKQEAAADNSCSKAIRLASAYRRFTWASAASTRSRLAMMYSNRGVMRAATGRFDLARRDLQKAYALDDKNLVYHDNLAALESSSRARYAGTVSLDFQ